MTRVPSRALRLFVPAALVLPLAGCLFGGHEPAVVSKPAHDTGAPAVQTFEPAPVPGSAQTDQ